MENTKLEVPSGDSKEEITAYQVGEPVDPKPGVKNQEDFSKVLIMECPLIGIGTAKLTVGVKKKTGMKIQYCITALET